MLLLTNLYKITTFFFFNKILREKKLSKRTSVTMEVIYFFCKNRGEEEGWILEVNLIPTPSAPVLVNTQFQRYN